MGTVNRHSAVRGDKSVFDGDFVFWAKKNSKHSSGPLAKERIKVLINRASSATGSGNDWIELRHKNGRNNDFRLSNVETLDSGKNC